MLIIVIIEMEVFLHSLGIFQIAKKNTDSSRQCQSLIESENALEQNFYKKKNQI